MDVLKMLVKVVIAKLNLLIIKFLSYVLDKTLDFSPFQRKVLKRKKEIKLGGLS